MTQVNLIAGTLSIDHYFEQSISYRKRDLLSPGKKKLGNYLLNWAILNQYTVYVAPSVGPSWVGTSSHQDGSTSIFRKALFYLHSVQENVSLIIIHIRVRILYKWLVKLFHWRSLTHHDISNYFLKIMELHTSAPDVGRLHVPVCVRIEEDKQQFHFTLHSTLRRTGNTTYFSATYTRSHVQFASLNSVIRSPNLYSYQNQWKHLNAKASFCIHMSSTS